ncbi:hypothetical protein [Undibacterium sp. TS12]|uniref:hypothetical protein n=1 Tax=Undibacterium sp. TS12 TaxID=2908202 RepID=UPI001F4C9C45|nr:hypothetical protein [Undibacterium sp. TS12]MCH8622593.1 hypothetical protein [Undibacterium sp. TS12]
MNTATTAVNTAAPAFPLRKILLLDAATCLLMGLLLLVAADFLSPILGLPANFLLGAGASLIPCFALLWFISITGSKTNPPAALVWLVIFLNADWVIASILTMELWFEPSALGIAFIVAQALTVVGFIVLEYRGLRAHG